MKKIILGLVALVGFSSPAFALENPPSDITIMPVLMGHLIDNSVSITDVDSQKSINVKISNCEESWNDGDKFLMIKSRSGNFFVIRAERFLYYYNASHDWDYTIQRIEHDGAICTITDQ